MAVSGIELMLIQTVFLVLLIVPIIFVIYWMVRILKNSNKNLKMSQEILEILKRKNDQSSA